MSFVAMFASAALAGAPSDAPSDASVADFADWHAGELMDWCLDTAATGEFRGVDGSDIAYASFTDSDNDGILLIASGRTESWIKYCEVVYDLQDLNMDIWLIDHRGQGFSERLLSDADKGHVEDFSDYVDDFETFAESIVGITASEDVYVLGHSMGGMVATRYVAEHQWLVDGLVLSAPMFGLNTDPYPETLTWWTAWGADWWGYGESYALGRGPYSDYVFADNGVTNSEGRYTAHRDQRNTWTETRLGGPTWSFLYEAITATRSIEEKADGFSVPTLLLQAADDEIVTPDRQDGFCVGAEDCMLLEIDSGRHELLQESDSIRDEVLYEVKSFLQSL